MAFTRPGQAAAQAAAPATRTPPAGMARPQTAQRTAMTPATPTTPIEIETASGELFTVSFEDVRHFISPKATDAECKIFLETCRAYHLNPFTKEAYLIHYDNKNDETPATIVLGKNCYLQMAERHPAFDGFEAGIVVYSEGQIVDREGSILYDGETLLGGWAKVYRKDRTRPGYDEVKLDEYNTGKSLWASKPATMIRKVALVHALRETFPSTFGLLYDESEINVVAEGSAREVEEPAQLPRRTRRPAASTKPAVEITTDAGKSDTEPPPAYNEDGDPFAEGEAL